MSYYILKILSLLKLTSGLRQVPQAVLHMNLLKNLPSDVHHLQMRYLDLLRRIASTRHNTQEYYEQKQEELHALALTIKEKMGMNLYERKSL